MAEIASGSIDLKSLKVAGEGASKYITAIDGGGIKIHEAGAVNTNFAQINSNGLQIYKRQELQASFGETIILGRPYDPNGSNPYDALTPGIPMNRSYIEVTSTIFSMKDFNNNEYFNIQDLRGTSGIALVTEVIQVTENTTIYKVQNEIFHNGSMPLAAWITINGSSKEQGTDFTIQSLSGGGHQIVFTTAPAISDIIEITYHSADYKLKAFTFGNRDTSYEIGGLSFSSGYNNVASGSYSYAEGKSSKASGMCSHAEGSGTRAEGAYSHAEGSGTRAEGTYSHAEGEENYATGMWSHAEGGGQGDQWTLAQGQSSHAEGRSTSALGQASHAQNIGTSAKKDGQTVIGFFNILDNGSSSPISGNGYTYDRGTYALIIGNGNDITRSNALTVDWSGNVNIASGAKYKIGGANLSPTDLGAADYITSKGTSGVWKYEKWASGKVEAWSTGISTGTLTMAAQGNMYRASNLSFTIPSGIFPEAPTNTEVFAGYSAAVFVAASGDASSATAISCQVWKATNATAAVNLKFHCVYYPSTY